MEYTRKAVGAVKHAHERICLFLLIFGLNFLIGYICIIGLFFDSLNPDLNFLTRVSLHNFKNNCLQLFSMSPLFSVRILVTKI